MKFCWTTLHVKNMEESLKFYQEIVGLPLIRQNKMSPEFELAFLGSGETQVELIYDQSKELDYKNNTISMGFLTNSLDEFMAEIDKKGIPIFAGPIQPNPTIRFLYILDPNGIKVQFIEFIS